MMSSLDCAAVFQQGAACVNYLSKAGALASKPRDSLTRWEPTFTYGGSRERGISHITYLKKKKKEYKNDTVKDKWKDRNKRKSVQNYPKPVRWLYLPL